MRVLIFLIALALVPILGLSQFSWQKFGSSIYPGQVNVIYAQNSTTRIFAGTENNGILFSPDNGITWTTLNNGLPAGCLISSITMSANQILTVANGVVYSASSASFTNLSWSELYNSNLYIPGANLVTVDNVTGAIWAFSKNAAFKASPSTNSWVNTSNGLSGVFGISKVTYNYNGSGLVLAWAGGIAEITSASTTWTQTTSSVFIKDANTQGVRTVSSYASTNMYVGGSNGIAKSINGSPFVDISHNLPTVNYSGSVIAPIRVNDIIEFNGNVFIATQDVSTGSRQGNVYKLSTGSSSWVKLGNGLPQNIWKYSMFTAVGNTLMVCGSEGIYLSNDDGLTWSNASGTLQSAAGIKSFDFLNDGRIVVATLSGRLYLGDSSGNQWQDITSSIFSSSIGHVKVDGNNIIYVSAGFAPAGLSSASGGLFYSKDLGTTWTKAFPADRASLMDINITSSNEVYFGGNFDPAPDGEAIHYTTNGGTNWNVVSVNNGSNGSIFCANKTSNGNLLAGSETGGVLRSVDNGLSFQSIGNTTGKSGNVIRIDIAPWGDLFIAFDYTRGMYFVTAASLQSGSPTATTLANFPTLTNASDVAFGSTNNLYVGTDKGFYLSNDNGNTFSSNNTGLNQLKILRLRLNKSDGFLYLSNGEGLFKSSSQVVATAPKLSQTITFSSLPNKEVGDMPFNLNATASSGLPISYSSSNSNVATISGNVLTIVGSGQSMITAMQGGNANYAAANDVAQSLVVTKADQVITFKSIPPKILADGSFTLDAVSTSGLIISYASSDPLVASVNGNVVTIHNTGKTDLTASQSGNNNYFPATSITQELVVTLVTGLEEVKSLSVFPNPNDGIFYVQNKNLDEVNDIELFTITGFKISTFSTQSTAAQEFQVDISSLNTGVYLLKIGKESVYIKVYKK